MTKKFKLWTKDILIVKNLSLLNFKFVINLFQTPFGYLYNYY